MAKKTRRGLIIVATMVMVIAGPVFAQDFLTRPDGTGGVVIIRYAGNAAFVVIPAAIYGMLVTFIGEWAFCYLEGLISVTIPASVTSIGGRAFSGCDNLDAASYSAILKRFGNGVF
jgi:hypothetical protein